MLEWVFPQVGCWIAISFEDDLVLVLYFDFGSVKYGFTSMVA